GAPLPRRSRRHRRRADEARRLREGRHRRRDRLRARPAGEARRRRRGPRGPATVRRVRLRARTRGMKLLPADGFGSAELAAAATAGYEGYFVPVHVDVKTFEFMTGAWDIDRARSRIAVDDGATVGIAMLGVRGDRGWIGGLGVVPPRRRDGIGRALME